MIARPGGHLDRLPPRVGRELPHAAQPLEPVGPERLDRDHGHRHGPDHRVAQHRPVGRVDARLRRLHDGDGPGGVDPEDARPRLRPALHLDHRARCRPRPGRRHRRPPGRSSSPTAASPRSSSRSAACSSGAASSSSTRRARPSRRSTRPSSSSAAARRARSARAAAGWSASSPASGSSTRSGPGRRRRRRYGFPVRPLWAEVLVGGVGCAAVLGGVWIANSYSWPEALASLRGGARHHGPEGGLIIPIGHRLSRS